LIKTNCNFCEKEIDIFPYRLDYHEKHFCNQTCYANWQRKNKPDWKRIETNCDFCNKKINVKLSKFKKFKHYFCSRDCTANWNKKNAPRGKNSPHWKEKIILNCSFCGKEINKHESLVNGRKEHFCSKKCFFQWKHENNPKGKDSPLWNKVLVHCDFCNEPFHLPRHKLKKSKYHFCDAKCMGKWRTKNLVGSSNPIWTGGKFPHYGDYWYVQKSGIMKRANYVSELSGDDGGKMETHHIIPIRRFIQKYIDLCLSDIPSVELTSFRVLPYDLIPSIIFEEANSKENLMYLTQPEHTEFEGMPPTFFDEIRRLNTDEEPNVA
jgi:hypothetical protein